MEISGGVICLCLRLWRITPSSISITLHKIKERKWFKFITKCDGQLLQIATAFLLQSATQFITSCDRYYKLRWIYYKLRQAYITKCDDYYKLRQHRFHLHLTVTDVEQSRWRLKEREFTFSVTFSLPSPSSDLKVPNVFQCTGQFSLTLYFISCTSFCHLHPQIAKARRGGRRGKVTAVITDNIIIVK